jgi:hypothetical protein
MNGEFQILIKGELRTYTNFDDIPEKIGAIIKFVPDYPESPHSEEDHKLISTFTDKLHELGERECQQLRG